MISAENITKEFGHRLILRGVTLDVARGECVRLDATDLSETSTMLRILATLVRPTSGILSIGAIDAIRQPFDVRRRIAYVDGTLTARRVSVEEYVWLTARSRGAKLTRSTHGLMTGLGLRPSIDVNRLGRSPRAATAVVAALAGAPDVLLLDDVLGRIDPQIRRRLIAAIEDARINGAAVVFTAAENNEVDELSQRVVSLHGGRINPSMATARQG